MKHKLLLTAAVLMLLMIVCSCSQVFEAGVSGTVKKESGSTTVGVADINVYVFTDKDERDAEYQKALKAYEDKTGNTKYILSSTSVASKTVTNANGEFTVNKVVWETKKSTYGKTADNQLVYLLFQNDDYKPTTEDVTVISDSTNANSVNVIIEYAKVDVDVRVTIVNVSTPDTPMTEARTVKYRVNDSAEDSTSITGSGTITIKVPKGQDNTIHFYLPTSGDNDTWEMTLKAGGNDKVEDQPLTINSGDETSSTKLYMRSTDYTVPAFSGRICDSTDTTGKTNEYDGVILTLSYSLDNKTWVKLNPGDDSNGPWETQTVMTSTEGNTPICTHGTFSGLGQNSTKTLHIADVKYSGTVRTVYYKIIYKVLKTEGSSPTYTNYKYIFKYNDGDETTLGNITLKATSGS